MLLAILATAAVLPSAQPASALLEPTPAVATTQDEDPKAKYQSMREEAADDVEKLWKVYDYCDAYGLAREGRSTLRAILKLDDDQKKAHELLGEVFYDGKWFKNQAKVDDYKIKQLEAEAKKQGKAVFDGRLVDPEDLPYLERGMVRTDDGEWVNKEEHEKRQAGWIQQDFVWVAPEEAGKIDEGLWKCGEEWLPTEAANEYRSHLGRWWRLPGDHFDVYSTCDREVAEQANWEAERIYTDLIRIFGQGPTERIPMLVLRNIDQYNSFASQGYPEGSPVELRGHSSLFGAYLAEVWQQPFLDGYMASSSVAYWDASNDAGWRWGRIYARYAAGLSFAEQLDPSMKTIREASTGIGDPQSVAEKFWAEKKIPAWLRAGAASYVALYFVDTTDQNNPHWARDWTVSRIANAGGLDPLEKVFNYQVSIDDIGMSEKLMWEAGLLVSFTIDGDCQPVQAKHLAFKDALKKGKNVEKAGRALAKALQENESQLRKYAGL